MDRPAREALALPWAPAALALQHCRGDDARRTEVDDAEVGVETLFDKAFAGDPKHLGRPLGCEVNDFFERYEMNSMRTRVGKLMSDGLLGEPASESAAPVTTTASALALRPAASLVALLEGTAHPVVAFNRDRVAALNGATGAFAVLDLSQFLEGASATTLAGHDVKGLFRAADEGGFDLFLESSIEGMWVFRRDAHIRRSFESLAIVVEDIPIVVPEVQLLYMAKSEDPKNQHDFDMTRPRLDPRSSKWLRDTLGVTLPGHAWMSEL